MSERTNREDGPRFTLRIEPHFTEIAADDWARLSATSRSGSGYNPFLSHAFLSALERSGSASPETGWGGCHLLLEDGAGRLVGAVPAYLKSHSQGEYVFDHGWADAFERAGGQYYPKLQVAVPFTPVTGPRLLAAKDIAAVPVRDALAEGLKQVAQKIGVSSVHVTFAPKEEIERLEAHGYLHRTDQQFHFRNPGYASYEAFLETLSSRKRKALRKERETAVAPGIEIEWLTGNDLNEAAWDAFFAFYMDTGSRKWGRPYLSRSFFSMIGESMAADILLVMARRGGRYIAGALNFLGSDAIYGRYWGCIEDHRYLHFELCYHQAIDYAIQHGLTTVEAGAQGEHKLARGYLPVTTHSAHYILHPGLRRAVANHLDHERNEVEEIGTLLAAHGPYKRS